MTSDRILKWGVLSTARHGMKRVIPAIQKSSNGRVIAIASRVADRARQAAAQLGIPKAHGSYEALLEDPEIDAVFIPLPNSLHREWTVRAAQAGKHVLCEKPLALNAAECEEMISASQAAGVELMEAFMYRFHPQNERIKELVDSGAIGEVRWVRSAFTFHLSDLRNIRLQRDLGGGGLMDVGCYCVNVARWIVGEEPSQVQAMALFGPESQVDEMLAGTLRFPGGAMAAFDCGFRIPFRQSYEIVGSDGIIEVPDPFIPPDNREAAVTVRRPGGDERLSFPMADQFQIMVEHFAGCVLTGQKLRFPAQDALDNMRVIDALYQAARSSRAVAL